MIAMIMRCKQLYFSSSLDVNINKNTDYNLKQLLDLYNLYNNC